MLESNDYLFLELGRVKLRARVRFAVAAVVILVAVTAVLGRALGAWWGPW